MDAIEPFRIAVADAVLDDLVARLQRARVPSPPILDGGETAQTIRRIEQLVAHWRGGYDWRAQQRRLNAVPHDRASVDGVGIHLLHVPGAGPEPLPLLLTNGWPSAFVEYLAVLEALTDPASHGGDAADSFTVVVATLPGYGFSDRCLDRDLSRVRSRSSHSLYRSGAKGRISPADRTRGRLRARRTLVLHHLPCSRQL